MSDNKFRVFEKPALLGQARNDKTKYARDIEAAAIELSSRSETYAQAVRFYMAEVQGLINNL